MIRQTRVALVEDHALLAEALLLSLPPSRFEVEIVPLTPPPPSRTALIGAICGFQPDVVLLDLDLGPLGDGHQLIRPLTQAGCRVVVLTGWRKTTRWGSCLHEGALTVLPKSAPLERIVDTLDRVTAGLLAIPRQDREEMISRWRAERSSDDAHRQRLDRLTQREAFVLQELIGGKRVAQVAREAYLSEATVRTHVKSILAKLEVSSQLAAVALARNTDWHAPAETGSRRGTVS